MAEVLLINPFNFIQSIPRRVERANNYDLSHTSYEIALEVTREYLDYVENEGKEPQRLSEFQIHQSANGEIFLQTMTGLVKEITENPSNEYNRRRIEIAKELNANTSDEERYNLAKRFLDESNNYYASLSGLAATGAVERRAKLLKLQDTDMNLFQVNVIIGSMLVLQSEIADISEHPQDTRHKRIQQIGE